MTDCNCSSWPVILAVGAIGAYFARKYLKGGQFTENVTARGKVVVVTGANTGIGVETVRELNLRGAKVYMLCRSEQRAAAAKEELVKEGCDGSRLIYVNCDLGNKENIRKCAAKLAQLESHIDILVNNAGVIMTSYKKTTDGHEMTWGTNHLGPFLLTELLLPLVEKAPEGRVVLVSSDGHYSSPVLDLATIDDSTDYGTGFMRYCQTKLANVMHGRELARRLKSRGSAVTVNSLHPGGVITEIGRDMSVYWRPLFAIFYPLMKSRRDGAQTSIYCALSTELKGVSGKYLSDCAVKKEAAFALDDLACKQLYDYSLKAVGLA